MINKAYLAFVSVVSAMAGSEFFKATHDGQSSSTFSAVVARKDPSINKDIHL